MSTFSKTSKTQTTHVAGPSYSPRKTGFGRWFRRLGWRYLVGAVAVAFAAFPVLYVVSASLNPLGTVASTSLIPSSFSLENYARLLAGERGPFIRWYGNTLVLCLSVAALQVFISSLGAYAFSRFRFRGRRAGLFGLLLIMMFPQFLAVIAIFSMFSSIGDVIPQLGLNTLLGYGLVMMGGTLGNVWLIKGFFDTVPRELDESAILDGCSHAQVYFQIIFPLVRPILATAALLAFVGTLNEFLIASIFLTDNDVKTLAPGLVGMIESDKSNNLGVFAAGAVLTIIPVVALFQYLQKHIVGGVTAGAVKG